MEPNYLLKPGKRPWWPPFTLSPFTCCFRKFYYHHRNKKNGNFSRLKSNLPGRSGKPYIPPTTFLCGPHFLSAKKSSSLEQGGACFLFPVKSRQRRVLEGHHRTRGCGTTSENHRNKDLLSPLRKGSGRGLAILAALSLPLCSRHAYYEASCRWLLSHDVSSRSDDLHGRACSVRGDFRRFSGRGEHSNFSIFRVRRFSESPEPLH